MRCKVGVTRRRLAFLSVSSPSRLSKAGLLSDCVPRLFCSLSPTVKAKTSIRSSFALTPITARKGIFSTTLFLRTLKFEPSRKRNRYFTPERSRDNQASKAPEVASTIRLISLLSYFFPKCRSKTRLTSRVESPSKNISAANSSSSRLRRFRNGKNSVWYFP